MSCRAGHGPPCRMGSNSTFACVRHCPPCRHRPNGRKRASLARSPPPPMQPRPQPAAPASCSGPTSTAVSYSSSRRPRSCARPVLLLGAGLAPPPSRRPRPPRPPLILLDAGLTSPLSCLPRPSLRPRALGVSTVGLCRAWPDTALCVPCHAARWAKVQTQARHRRLYRVGLTHEQCGSCRVRAGPTVLCFGPGQVALPIRPSLVQRCDFLRGWERSWAERVWARAV